MEPQKLTEVIALCLFAVEYRRRMPARRRRLPPVKAGCKPTASQSCRPFLWLFFARPSRPSRSFTLVFPARESLAFGAFFLKVQVFQRLLASTATSHASRCGCCRARALSHTRTTEALCTLSAAAHHTQCGVWRGARMLLLTPP